MKLLEKINPRATWQSVVRQAVLGGVSCPLFFVAVMKPELRAHWRILLPIFAIVGAGIAALVEWQVYDGPEKPKNEDWSEAFDD
jgi:hypothetical protein